MESLSFVQSASILNATLKQLTGETTSIAPVDTESFISMATTVNRYSKNMVMDALTQVITRTFFSIRPYSRKLKGLKRDSEKWGNHIRKINYIDSDLDSTNKQYDLVDGQSVDHYVVKKPKVVETNYYGGETHSDHITRFENQLDTAFQSPEEFGRFVAGYLQALSDKFTQIDEGEDRLLMANFIGAKNKADYANVKNLLSIYYLETGTYLVNDVTDPRHYANKENIGDFSKWVSGYINTLSEYMTERSVLYHMNLEDSQGNAINIPRHTPKAYQHMYLFTPIIKGVKSRILTDAFNPEKMGIGDFEEINFWQNINEPDKVSVFPNYINDEGEEVVGDPTKDDPTVIDHVFGIIFDDDTMGKTIINTRTATTPLNASGLFWNTYFHWTSRHYTDLTENGIVLVLAQTEDDPDEETEETPGT